MLYLLYSLLSAAVHVIQKEVFGNAGVRLRDIGVSHRGGHHVRLGSE